MELIGHVYEGTVSTEVERGGGVHEREKVGGSFDVRDPRRAGGGDMDGGK